MRVFIAVLLLIFLTGCAGNATPKEQSSSEISGYTDYSENKFIEGEVVSKRINSFTMVDDKTNEEIIVTMYDEKSMRLVKRNKRVRVWFDYLRESNPGQTKAHRVELIE